MDNRKIRYWYSVPDAHGFPVSRYRWVTIEEFKRITHIDPITGNLC